MKNFYIFSCLLFSDLIFSKTVDELIKNQIFDWQSNYNKLDLNEDGQVSVDEFAAGHKNIISIIGNQFFDGAGMINFDQYCLYMVLFTDQDSNNLEINEKRLKNAYEDYCRIRQPEPNGLIEVSDFFKDCHGLLSIDQFEDIVRLMSIALSFDFHPGEINYKQFKEFVVSLLAFSLMDRDHNRFLSSKEVKIFLKLMGKYNPSEEEVREFFASHDEDDDGEVSVYEFLLTKY